MTSIILGMSTVRDEDDIVYDSLLHMSKVVDHGIVVDCGSIDRTAEEITKACRDTSNLVCLGNVGPTHARKVRRHIWHRFRKYFGSNAWWMIADADEFVEQDVREKVKSAAKEYSDHMFSVHANFYYTTIDHKLAGQDSAVKYGHKHLRHYRTNVSQVRIFRNLPWLRWNHGTSFPTRLCRSATDRVVFRHYQYRNIEQIEKRIAIRRQYINEPDVLGDNPHWNKSSAEDCIYSAEGMSYWDGVSQFVPSEDTPPRKPQGYLKSLAKYSLAILEACVTPQKESMLFNNIEMEI